MFVVEIGSVITSIEVIYRPSAFVGLVVRITSDPGETFLDRMIALVEGAIPGRTAALCKVTAETDIAAKCAVTIKRLIIQ